LSFNPRDYRLIFMASPDFAIPSLKLLLKQGYQVPLILSQPDRPSGRGRKLKPTDVSRFALDSEIDLLRPEKLRDADLRAEISAYEADIFVVVAYRILPPKMIALPKLGAINLHTSYLPRYKGAAPVQRAIMDGATETGISTFLIDKGVDSGKILLQKKMAIGADETTGELHERMMVSGAELLAKTVEMQLRGMLKPITQEDGDWPLAPKLSAEDRQLDFNCRAVELHNQIRALAPVPSTYCRFRNRLLKVQRSRICTEGQGQKTGALFISSEMYPAVKCAEHSLELLEVAPEGSRKMDARSWINGVRLQENECLQAGNQVTK
jgi:methionyl-tRNA formyltransferase